MSSSLSTDRRRHLRIPVIDRCLQTSGTRWSARQLLDKVNAYLLECDAKPVDIRTIQKDLKYLEGLPHNPAPIEFTDDGRVRYYYYSDRYYELEAAAANADQLFALTLAHEVLGQLQGFTVIKEVESLRRLLEKQVAQIEMGNFPILLFETAPALKGIELLEPLFEAIREKTVLKISYKPFGVESAIEKTIHPWWLKQSNQRWFLFGWDDANKRLDNSPLDRIEKIGPVSTDYKTNTHVDPVKYFEPLTGVTRREGDTPENIVLKVYGRRADYVATKPLHSSQQILESKDNAVLFGYSLIINDEWISRLQSLGADAEVVSPESLRSVMKVSFVKSLERY